MQQAVSDGKMLVNFITTDPVSQPASFEHHLKYDQNKSEWMILQKPSTVRSYVDKNSFEEVARDVKPEDVPTDFKGYGSGKPIILTSSNERSNKIDYCSKKQYEPGTF